MLSYILEAGICWTGFYLLYILFLQKETFFHLNRIYLLATLVLGLLIPTCELSFWTAAPEQFPAVAYYLQPITITVQSFEYNLETIVVSPEASQSFAWSTVLLWIYLAGLVFFAFRTGWGLRQIYQLYRQSEIENRPGYHLVKTAQMHSPFSFFSWLFWSKDLQLESEETHYVLQHELAHIQQGHSLDVLLLEFLSIIFWCLPPVHYYKKELRNVHEYLADAAVYHTTPKKQYGRLLLKQAQSGQQPALAHHFFHSQLKQRIIMMTKNKSSRSSLFKYLGLLPLAAFLLLAFSSGETLLAKQDASLTTTIFNGPEPYNKKKITQQFKTILQKLNSEKDYDVCRNYTSELETTYTRLINQYPDKKEEITVLVQQLVEDLNAPVHFVEKDKGMVPYYTKAKDGNIYSVVEQMPYFGNCKDEDCSTNAMLKHVYSNVKYPKAAREKGVEGMVVVEFVISKTGEILQPKVVRSLGSGCDEEVLRVVRTMPKWNPGQHKGEKVDVQFKLPVKFKLAGGEDKVLDRADRMPSFPGCDEEATEAARKQCGFGKLVGYIGENLKYPKDAKEAGIEGVVAVRFIINKEGTIEKPKLVKSIGYGCDEAVLEVLEKMKTEVGAWTPGQMNDGKKVSVYFTLPVAFRLEAGDREKIASPVKSLALSNFSAFPNPVSDELTVNFETEPGPTQVEVRSLDGKVIQSINLSLGQSQSNTDGHYNLTFDMSKAAAGTAVLSIRQGEKVFSQKILVQR